MEISWFESFLYGIVGGLTEILPVSSHAHQSILQSLFGLTEGLILLRFSVSMGAFVAFVISLWPLYQRIRGEYRISRSRRRRRSKAANMQYVFDWNVVKTACVPLLLGGFLYKAIGSLHESTPVIALFLILNGFILHLPIYFAKGNKDSRTMSRLDGMLLGLASVLGYFPGVSRIAAGLSVSSVRGADNQHSLKWSMLLSAPALLVIILMDIFTIAASDIPAPDVMFLLKCFMIAITACIGTCIGIFIVKKLLARKGTESLAYYCWGAALFSFILYLY